MLSGLLSVLLSGLLSDVPTDETSEEVVEDAADDIADEFADDAADDDEETELIDEAALLLCSLNEPTLSPADSFALFEQPVNNTAANTTAVAAFPIPCFTLIISFSFSVIFSILYFIL